MRRLPNKPDSNQRHLNYTTVESRELIWLTIAICPTGHHETFQYHRSQFRFTWHATKKERWLIMMSGQERKVPCCSTHTSPMRRPVKLVSGNFRFPYTLSKRKIRKNLCTAKIRNNRKSPLMVHNTRSVQQTKEFYIGNHYKHQLVFRNDRRRTCRLTNANWGGRAENIWAPLRKHGNWRKA